MLPKVSIIIPFYNCPFVDQAIQSAVHQTYPNLEIIVVNDGSISYADKIVPFMKKIRLIEKNNGGTASALNIGIQHAVGDYIAWLSSDDLYYPNKIARQLAFMYSYSASISFTNFDHIDSLNNVTARSVNLVFPNFLELYRECLLRNPINGSTVMIKKELLSTLGGFNQALPYTHDYDLWIRAIVAGYTPYYLNDSLTMYRIHGRMGTILHRPAIDREVELIQGQYANDIKAYIKSLC
jgi:teichuronic acid biosynthesis glycosyltransferase TuaG